MKFRAFKRLPRGEPRFAQDCPTYILLGRYCHMYNETHAHWFFISDVLPYDGDTKMPLWLNRQGTTLWEVSVREFLGCGKRAYLELMEDLVGIRFTTLARWLWRPYIFRWMPGLKRLAFMDDNQDWTDWDRYERPKVGGASHVKPDTESLS